MFFNNINKKICKWIDESLYHDYEDRWDDNEFRNRVISFMKKDSVLLDVGAGSGKNLFMNFRGLCKIAVGIDIDQSVLYNPLLNEAKVAPAENIPYGSEYFDIIICANTLEHLENPFKTFKEMKRVLKKGGYLLVKTSNKYHYVGFLGRITPFYFHKFWNKLRKVNEYEVFPKYYRANSKRSLYMIAKKLNLNVVRIELLEGRPEYLRMFFPLYFIGFLFERIVNKFKFMESFKCVIIGIFQKLD